MAKLPEFGKAFHITFRLSRDTAPNAYQSLWNLIRSHSSYAIGSDGEHHADYRQVFSDILNSENNIDMQHIPADAPLTIGMLEKLMQQQEENFNNLLADMGGTIVDNLLNDLSQGIITVESMQEESVRETYTQDVQEKAKERLNQYQNRYK